jgi:hypothetical protein
MLNFLYKEYGLDINWMLYGHGVVIFSRLIEARKDLKTKRQKKISAKASKNGDGRIFPIHQI